MGKAVICCLEFPHSKLRGMLCILRSPVLLGITVNHDTVLICCTFVICLAWFPAVWGQFVEWHVNTIYFFKPN